MFANDGDTTDLDKVLFDITAGDTNGNFRIGSDGSIFVQTALDREQTDSYSLQVRAAEKSDATASSFTTISIAVTDLNDNAPLFAQSSYSVDVSEGSPLMQVILTGVSVSDADTGANAQFVFSLSASSVFTVQPTSGKLCFSGYSTASSYQGRRSWGGKGAFAPRPPQCQYRGARVSFRPPIFCAPYVIPPKISNLLL